MRMHPRAPVVDAASSDLMRRLLDWTQSHELTDIERLRIINTVLGDNISLILKYMLRVERHGEVDIPADATILEKGKEG